MRFEVIRRISRKELTLFFASPIGYLFLLSFLAVTLFIFFWVEAKREPLPTLRIRSADCPPTRSVSTELPIK